MQRSFAVFFKRSFVFVFLVFLVSCGSDEKVNKEREVSIAESRPYILKADISRFIGNTVVPDFRFNEDFIRENKIKSISCIEKTVMNKRPADTMMVSPAMVWLIDATGKTKELQIFNSRGEKVHSEFYLLPEEVQRLNDKNIDLNTSAATIYFYEDSLLQLELRTEPQNSDTTKYFYATGKKLDSITVNSMSEPPFYLKFLYNDDGTIQRRVVRQPGVKMSEKDWQYVYDTDGLLKSIIEKNSGSGAYHFKWDIEGKLTYVDYVQNGTVVFKKNYNYNNNGLLTTAKLETPESVSFFEFGYAR